MDNDHIENQETVASWLTPPAHKTRKTKTTKRLFLLQNKTQEEESSQNLQGATLIPTLGIQLHLQAYPVEHISDSWLCQARC